MAQTAFPRSAGLSAQCFTEATCSGLLQTEARLCSWEPALWFLLGKALWACAARSPKVPSERGESEGMLAGAGSRSAHRRAGVCAILCWEPI